MTYYGFMDKRFNGMTISKLTLSTHDADGRKTMNRSGEAYVEMVVNTQLDNKGVGAPQRVFFKSSRIVGAVPESLLYPLIEFLEANMVREHQIAIEIDNKQCVETILISGDVKVE